jgi:hypothetical protein
LCLRENLDTEENNTKALQAVVNDVTRDGRQWISTTLVNGRTVIRVMIISYLTEQRHLELLLARLHEAATAALLAETTKARV